MGPFIRTPEGVTLIANGKPITVNKDNKMFPDVIKAIRDDDWDRAVILADKATCVMDFVRTNLGQGVEVIGDHLFYNGEQMHGYLVDKIISFMQDRLPIGSLINFMNKLMENPSKRCVDRLFMFLEQGNMPIDPDGDFYAYKAVRSDWKDKHTGTILNRIGDKPVMPRNKVDDDMSHDCSYGLHAGSLQYVESFMNKNAGDIVIIVKINPADVVSVPESDCRKLRCCKYEIVGQYTGPLPEHTYYERPETIDYSYEDDYKDEDDYNDED